MATKEKQEKLVATMRQWQKIEDATVVQTAKMRAQTENALIRQVMDIIQRDSIMHHRVQQMVIDSLESEQINVPVDELVQMWDSIEQHIQLERKTIALAKESLEDLAGTKNVVQTYLVSFLKADEEKHDKLLSDLELIKKSMYPYG